jgi:hypothetical protein
MSADQRVDDLDRAVRRLELTGKRELGDSESSADGRENGVLRRETCFEDDQTHLSNSSTKPTSFDSKSMASVTTFALDEKDSLRPDDSASVQAADEEESLSGPASGAPNSLTGSESGARGFRDQFRDGKSQRVCGPVSGAGPRFADGNLQMTGAIPPDSVANNFIMVNPDNFQGVRMLHVFPPEPDDKLLEAMNSPKDRLLLLQLEEKIRIFLQDSKEQSLELPPSNAFGRLLAHRLGDYYHLTHFVDNNVTSVRLHRTPFSRLPTPLSMLRPTAANNTPPPNAPAMKIMRRADQNADRPSAGPSTAASSSVPSKAASESEGDGNDEERTGSSAGATPAKDRAAMTREEREAKYQEARERIFRDFPESKNSDANNGDQSANMSRSSSTSGRKKNYRQKMPHDDSFEVRSQFNVYLPGMPYTNAQVPLNVGIHDGSFAAQNPYIVGPSAAPAMTYVPNGQNNIIYPPHLNMNSAPQYPMAMPPHMGQNSSWQGPMPPQSPFPAFASISQPPPMMGQQPSTRSSPAMNNYAVPNSAQFQQTSSTWVSPPYQGSYQQPNQRSAPPVHWPNYPPPSMGSSPPTYPYAQIPSQHYTPTMQNPGGHPIPGGYPRSSFNPQTRSFVPGSASPSRYPVKNYQHGTNSYGNPQAGTQQQWPAFQDTQGQMARLSSQASNKGPNIVAYSNVNVARAAPSGSQDSIAKWGTPSHLPPKPPPSEVPSEFDMKNRNTSISSNSYSNMLPVSKNGPLVVSGATSLPKPN